MKIKTFLCFVLSLSFCLGVHAQVPITNGLVAYFPFNGNANDASGNGYDGLMDGATLIPDRFGNTNAASRFDGSAEIILAGTTNLNFSSGGFTVCAWIAWTQDNVHQTIVGKHLCGSQNGFYLALNRNKPYFYVGNGAVETEAALPMDGQWHFVVARYDGSVQNLYLDGFPVGGAPRSYITYNDVPLKIGRQSGGAGCFNEGYFLGNIDDVSIYNRPLSEGEILQLFEQGFRVHLQKLVKPWFSGLEVGTNYQLQLSTNLIVWTNQGSPFIATNSVMPYPQSWDVSHWHALHFRLQVAP